ncbi:MAG: hypothetical protein ACK56F_27910 [bacterium]
MSHEQSGVPEPRTHFGSVLGAGKKESSCEIKRAVGPGPPERKGRSLRPAVPRSLSASGCIWRLGCLLQRCLQVARQFRRSLPRGAVPRR